MTLIIIAIILIAALCIGAIERTMKQENARLQAIIDRLDAACKRSNEVLGEKA